MFLDLRFQFHCTLDNHELVGQVACSMGNEVYSLSNILSFPWKTITCFGGFLNDHLIVGMLTPSIFALAEWLNPIAIRKYTICDLASFLALELHL